MNIYLICTIVLLLLIIRIPVFLSLGSGCLIYFITHHVPLATFANRAALSIDAFPLIAIPLFILAGSVMNTGGITTRLFRFCQDAVGFIPGGLGHVAVLAGIIFAGMSGSALADIGGIGQIEIKAMREAKYPIRFSVGVTLISSVLAPIIPPSIAAVIYAINTDVSVAGLFLAGVLPGLFIALMLMIFVYVLAIKLNIPREPFPRPIPFLKNFFSALPALMTPVILIGGMALGVFSPTEAAVVAVCYSIILGVFFYREIGVRDLIATFVEVGTQVAILMLIVATAIVFGWLLTLEQVPQDIAALILEYKDYPHLVLLLVIIVILGLGCFIEVTVLLLLLPPILVPALTKVGFDPLHLGIVMIIAMMLGMYSPPFGVGLFAMQQVAKLSFSEVVRSVTPFLIPVVVALLVLTFFPSISLVVPHYFGFR